jgi:hypothetical protein
MQWVAVANAEPPQAVALGTPGPAPFDVAAAAERRSAVLSRLDGGSSIG